MITYRNNPQNNIVEISIQGKITEADFDQIISQLKADFKTHGKLRILEEIYNFGGIDPWTLWKDIQFSLTHLNDFTHAAVVTDDWWLRLFAEGVGLVLSTEVKAFEASQLETAREWLARG
jgi:hypothetical protein